MTTWLVLFAAAALVAGPAAAQRSSAALSYRIGPRDQLQIRVEELPELDREQVVAEDGTIVLPVVGSVDAQGLTEDQLALRLRSRLVEEGLRTATVSVVVTQYRSRPLLIVGAVGKPGNHYVPGRATLLGVLMDAGGLKAGHGNSIYVRRRAENGLSDQIEIPVQALIEAGDPALNIPIFAGDTINVQQARQVTIHLLGQVQQPGSLTFEGSRPVTLLTAIAKAGGLRETASNKIQIKRRNPSGELRELVVEFRAILNGRAPDPELEDSDLIIVKESFF